MSFDDKFAFPELPPWKISPLPKKNEENTFVSNDAFPSPLDRIKSKKGKKARALAFGLSNQSMSKSFEANQSLPVCIRKAHKSKEEMYGLVKSEHSFSYSTIFSSNSRGSYFDQSSIQGYSSWNMTADRSQNSIMTGDRSQNTTNVGEQAFHHGILNPNKIVLSLDINNKVLLSNNMACQLLGFNSSELQKLTLDDFVLDPENGRGIEAMAETEVFHNLNAAVNGKVLVSGKVVDVTTKSGNVITMSLWLKHLGNAGETGNVGRKLAILEPVARTVGKLRVGFDGQIMKLDSGAESLFDIKADVAVGKQKIHAYLPQLHIPDQTDEITEKESFKQRTVGRTKDGVNFPVATRLQLVSDLTAYDIQIWVFTNISGLVLLDTEGNIESCNPHFVKILFGQSEMDLKGKSITALIPGFFDDLVFGSYDSSIDEETDETASGSKESLDNSSCGSNERESNSGLHSLMNLLNTNDSIPQKSPRPQKFLAPTSFPSHHEDKENRLSASNENEIEEDIIANELKHLTSTPAGVKIKSNIHLRSKVKAEFPEGRFFGFGRHRDGAEINILYQIRRVSLEDKSYMYCLWIAKDPDDYTAVSRLGTLTLESSNAETKDDSLGESIRRAVEKRNEMRILQLNHAKNGGLALQEEVSSGRSDSSFLLCKGSYNEKYCTLQQIGKGAFGCVKTAFRRSDRRMVVTKFIKRSKVFDENWVTDTVFGMRVPLEISLLSTLEHPNIVQVLDVHENEEYLQLVMQRHGAGMDLFEFLDRRPKMDEPLASYIFRQVVCAIEYLHKERGLLHRDIKDENVIINEHFHVKLIDFGSVAPIPKDGWLYSTFYGTVEYCSPEVLNGNCYAGRELEMWTLGILLYVMIFNENPFYGVEETLQCQLKPPFAISPLCMDVIKKLLEKDPHLRMRLDQLACHEWVTQAVQIEKYSFKDVVHCSDDELHPIQYYPETPSKSDDKLISSLISRETGVLEDSTNAATVEASANSLSDSLLHILD